MYPLTLDVAAAEAWLRRPCPELPAATRAECLGVDEQIFGRGLGGFLSTVDDILAAAPAGLHRRPDITEILLWLIPDGDILDQGALITVDLANTVRLASEHQDIKDFADRDQRGIPAVLSALSHIANQVCLLVQRYQHANPGYQPLAPAAIPTGSTGKRRRACEQILNHSHAQPPIPAGQATESTDGTHL